MRWLKGLLFVIAILGIVYLLGPRPATPVYDPVLPATSSTDSLEKFIAANEAAHKVRAGNEAKVVWANDSVKQKTPYSIVYLHGFSASQKEGDPVHRDMAREFGCNLYLARLAEHGLDTVEQLINLTADNYWKSAQQALAIGLQLGNKVILMGTSTGGTQALQLAATYPDKVAGLILYSPNIAINDPNAWILNNHWGLQIARMVKKGNYITSNDTSAAARQYWYTSYRIEGAVALEEMVETTMKKETFSKITQPTLLLYYYKDDQHQDPVVKVSAMKEMFTELATRDSLKKEMALPNTGNHVIGSPIKSKDVMSVENKTAGFLKEIMHLRMIAGT